LLAYNPRMSDYIIHVFDESADIKRRFARAHADKIAHVAQLIGRALRDGYKALLFGNGGSATDASHIAAEFVGRYHKDRAPLPALALATDMAAITCIANDYGYDEVFARQVLAHGRKGDIAIGISTSGNSSNVLNAVVAAREAGLTTIAWTGGTGGKLAPLVDFAFIVPSTVTARIQECHATLGHVLCELIEDHVFAK
jgi:D-sedoheptulose 7-phosphate isomerase